MFNNEDDRKEAEQHIIIALGEFKSLPKTHEELVEALRDYFVDQKVGVFSRMVAEEGEVAFREFIEEVVLKSGKYARDEKGKIRPH